MGFREDPFGSKSHPSSLETIFTNDFGNFEAESIILDSKDQDVFMFRVKNGANINVNFGCKDTRHKNNLRIEAAVYDENWNLITSNNTIEKTANISAGLSEGIYYLVFDGVGYLDPTVNGYSDYGSVGKYSFNGSITVYSDEILDIGISSNTQFEDYTCDEMLDVEILVENNG